MAIKITTDGYLQVERPINKVYSISDIRKSLNTDDDFIKFVDMGSFVLIVDSAPDRKMNSVGSLFFRFGIYGEVLIMSGNELPTDAYIRTTENTKWDIEGLEAGIVKSIKDALRAYQLVMNYDDSLSGTVVPNDVSVSSHVVSDTNSNISSEKKIYLFDPDKDEEIKEDEQQFINAFYESAYESIKNVDNIDPSKIILFEDNKTIIKFAPDKVKKTLNEMIRHFTEYEEYEKCSVIKKISTKIKDITQTDVNNAVQE